MKSTAIISEYNPFHNGHKYQIQKSRENGSTHIISVMGGNFLQRGNCAILDKYNRAKAAILGGVDLVIELPQIYAVGSAEKFAFGAVQTLDKCGCVDELAFGAECGDILMLKRTVDIITRSGEVETLCKQYLKQGYSHPRAMQAAVEYISQNGDNISDILKSPNNTLAIEYIKVLNNINSNINPFAIKRVGAMHGSMQTNNEFASASAVREMILNGDNSYKKFIPNTTAEIISDCITLGECPGEYKNNSRGIMTVLRSMTAEDFANIPDVTEGLENRLVKAAKENNSVLDIITAVKCKRYTHARLSRIIACAYLGITKDISSLEPKYIRVLAFNDRGTEILKLMKKSASLPVIMSPAKDMKKLDDMGKKIFEIDLRASDLYGLLTPNVQRCGNDFYKAMVINNRE